MIDDEDKQTEDRVSVAKVGKFAGSADTKYVRLSHFKGA